MSYTAHVCRIKTRPHFDGKYTNIQIGTCFDSDVIVSNSVNDGDFGVYFPPDGQLSEEFCLSNNLLREHPQTGEKLGGYLEASRRIRALKLCQIESMGIWMPISAFEKYLKDAKDLPEGYEFNSLGGTEICRKYVTPETLKQRSVKPKKSREEKKKISQFFLKHYDTPQWKFCHNIPRQGAICIITEKLHGTSARTGKVLCQVPKKLSKIEQIALRVSNKALDKIYELSDKLKPWPHIEVHFQRLAKKIDINHIRFNEQYQTAVGSRNVTTGTYEEIEQRKIDGFYSDNSFRWKAVESWASLLHQNEIVYYEIVGYSGDAPIQKGASMTDKALIRRYGKERMDFHYGCKPGEFEVYVYRIAYVDQQTGKSEELSWTQIQKRCKELGLKTVPDLDRFVYDGNLEELSKRIDSFVSGDSTLTSRHLREGVCVRFEQDNGVQVVKAKSYDFFVVEGMAKDSKDHVDIEEAEEQTEEAEQWK